MVSSGTDLDDVDVPTSAKPTEPVAEARVADRGVADEPAVVAAPPEPSAEAPGPVDETPTPPARTRPSRPARVVRAIRHSAPSTRARALVGVAALAVAVAVPVVARDGLADARVEAAVTRGDGAAAAEQRSGAEADRASAGERAAEAADAAVVALETRNELRHRLAALGLNEASIDAFLDVQLANTELVEYRRDTTTADVDRQAQEIPQMEACLQRATHAANEAFNTQFGNAPPPGPSELCRALLG